MQIIGYIGYGILILITVISTMGIRTELGLSTSTMLIPLLLIIAAIALPTGRYSLLNAWWIIPAAYVASFAANKLDAQRSPLLYFVVLGPVAIFAAIIRTGIPKERIQRARAEAWRKALDKVGQ